MKKIVIVLIMAMLLLSGGGCSNGTEDVTADTKTLEIKHTVDAYGTIEAMEKRNIVIDFTSKVTGVSVKEGQRVKIGEALGTLDLSEYEAQIKSKEFELQSLRSEIIRVNSKNNLNPELKKALDDAKIPEDLYTKFIKALTSKQDLSYIAKADAFNTDLKVMKDKINTSYLKGNQIICDMQNAVVCNIAYRPGDITVSSKSFASLIDIDSLAAEVYVDEEFIKDVKLGLTASVIPLADKSKAYKGKVTYISERAETKNGQTTIPVLISIDDKGDFIKPGYNVDVKIDIAK